MTTYSLDRWNQYAGAEATKIAAWHVDVDALYNIRFAIRGWATELPKKREMWELYKAGGALVDDIPSYSVRGVSIFGPVGGSKLPAVMFDWSMFPVLDLIEVVGGTWILDLVIRATSDRYLMNANTKQWCERVASIVSKVGLGKPDVQLMGIVTVHCGPGATKCRAREPDKDPDPVATASTESFWIGIPDLVTVLPPEQAGAEPTIQGTEAFQTGYHNGCVGAGGIQLALGLYDYASDLFPMMACAGGEGWITKENVEGSKQTPPNTLPNPLDAPDPRKWYDLSRLTTGEKTIVAVFALAGLVIGTKLRRMVA